MKQIMVVDDEKEFRNMLAKAIKSMDFDVITAGDGKSALKLLEKNNPGIIFLDMNMGGNHREGLSVFEEIKKVYSHIPVVFVTGYGDIKLAVDLMKLGAHDFLEKPVELANIREIIHRISGSPVLNKESVIFGGIKSVNPALIEIVQLLEIAAESDAHMLITGESGTGKEVAAQYIHDHSPRNDKPFIKMNCAAIPPNLMEAEVFGVEKGAFTGASKTKPGRFEAANGGTLLLDEIGEMEISLQAKLLRVIQEKEFERVGSVKPRKVDVRIVATTNRNLQKSIEDGLFREDLYYRLNVFEVTLPPLSERKNDIIPLAEKFVKEFSPGIFSKLSSKLISLLTKYTWPGNIRELKNAMERATILARGGTVLPKHLPPNINHFAEKPSIENISEKNNALSNVEKNLIIETLKKYNGNRTHTAKALGISRRALQYKIKRWKIE
jgi:two-component system, NtrC family, response regulator AtoC